jgi:hypothetical protein
MELYFIQLGTSDEMQQHLFLKEVKPEIYDFWIDELDPNESITDLSPSELIEKYAEKEHTDWQKEVIHRVKTSSYRSKEKKEKPIQCYHCNGLGHTRPNCLILRETPAAQTPAVPPVSNPPGPGGGGYTGGRGFSRDGSQKGRGYYPWRGGREPDRSDRHSKVNVIGLIGDWGVEERRLLNKMANSVLAMFLIRMGNIKV